MSEPAVSVEMAAMAAMAEAPVAVRHRQSYNINALGAFLQGCFADPGCPVRSYSDLERAAGVSREAISRYVSANPQRRRSPTVDALVPLADALHVSVEALARAAAAASRGDALPERETQASRRETLGGLAAGLTVGQYNALVEVARQMARPALFVVGTTDPAAAHLAAMGYSFD